MSRAIFLSSLFSKARWGVALGIVLHFVEEIMIGNVMKTPEKSGMLA